MTASTITYSGPFAFFRKHFNGDYSLGRSYWVNTFLTQFVTFLVGIMLVTWVGKTFPARYGSAGVLLLIFFGTAIWVWAIAGAWASANKHVGRGGKRFWAISAKCVIVLGIVRTCASLVGMSGQLAEHWKVATGWQLGPEVSIQVRADGKSILLKGGINDGAAEALAEALARSPSVRTVVLQSNGGWIRQGDMIAKVITDHGLNTYVEQECSSACTLAFLAGKERAAEPNARIGFHSFQSIGGGTTTSAIDAAAAQRLYRQAGLSSAFIAKIIATPHDRIWYPSHEELLSEGVFTRVSLGGESASIATTAPTREKLIAEFIKVPVLDALSKKYPQEFNAIIDQALLQVQAKKADNEVMGMARMQIGRLSEKFLPIVADATLLEFNLLLEAQAEALKMRNPEVCVELIFPKDRSSNLAAFLPKELLARQLDWLTEMVRTSDPKNAQHLPMAEKQRIVKGVLNAMPALQVQYLVSKKLHETSPRESCQAVIGYLSVMNHIGANERARSIRAIYTPN
jgi:ATP-dependent protease ClpP protease subunit